MTLSRTLSISLLSALLVVSVTASAWWWSNDDEPPQGPATEIAWEDLVPADYVPPKDPFSSITAEEYEVLLDGSDDSNRRLAERNDLMTYAPTVAELDGKRVRLPGFVVPLDFDSETQVRVSEFLIVPYYGACIHTPPPPANQVVHAKSGRSVQIESLYDPVWATGTLTTEVTSSDLAEAGYLLKIESIEPYTEADR